MKRDIQGKFALKNNNYRSVRSLRLTDSTWKLLGEAAESLDITRADLLEQIARGNSHFPPGITRLTGEPSPSNIREEVNTQPGNTWLDEIERLKAEVQHLHQEKALLVERLALSFPQRADLDALRHQVLKELKLGKQAPGYKAAQKALEHFIVELIKSDKNGVF
jgi:hypothetical protein